MTDNNVDLTDVASDDAEDIADPLDGLAEKVAADLGVPFTPEVLGWLSELKRKDRAVFEALRTKLKEAGCLAEAINDAVSLGNHRPPEFSDEALAVRFADQYKHDLRYVSLWSRWLQWDGTRWVRDETLQTFSRSRDICKTAAAECDKERTAKKIASAKTAHDVERLARSDRRLAATTNQWDLGNYLLNTPDGTVDLETGQLREHHRHDYLTKMTAVGPQGNCPRWIEFLDCVCNGDVDLQHFLQRVIGYTLTGEISEHAIFFLHGTGANGKSVFISTISGVLRDYHRTGAMDTFVATHNVAHPTDLAGLRGARLVTAVETGEGRRWAESKIKALTGGDKIAARFMRQDFFEFTPQFKLLIAGNHRPGLRTVDEAIRRRLHLVPFTVTIPPRERDKELTEKLKDEWPGILQWAIEGCLQWRKFGLDPPASVREATEDYLEAEDTLNIWINECCDVSDASGYTSVASLYARWKEWADKSGEFAGTMKAFSQKLEDRRFKRHRKRNERGFVGIAVNQRDPLDTYYDK